MRTWPWEKQLSPWVGNFHSGLEAAGNNSFSPEEGTHQSILYTKGESVKQVSTKITRNQILPKLWVEFWLTLGSRWRI